MPYKNSLKQCEYSRNYARIWRSKHREHLREQARKRYYKNDTVKIARAEYNRKNRISINQRQREYVKWVKEQCFIRYGGYICKCCNEKNRKFLTIDHETCLSTKSNFERKNLYSYLKSKGFPTGFRVLCYNCNLGRDKNNGICPHTEVI